MGVLFQGRTLSLHSIVTCLTGLHSHKDPIDQLLCDCLPCVRFPEIKAYRSCLKVSLISLVTLGKSRLESAGGVEQLRISCVRTFNSFNKIFTYHDQCIL